MRMRDEADTVQLSKIRIKEPVRAALELAAAAHGITLNAEIADRLERSLRGADRFDETMTFTLGEDGAGLLHVVAEVIRATAPRGPWLDDEAASELVARGIVRLLRLLRLLRTPNDANIAEDGPPEKTVDTVLYDLGNDQTVFPDGTVYQGAGARWAAEKRRRFGGTLARRLIEMRRVVRAAREAMPVPEAAELWERVIRWVNEAPPPTPQEYVDEAKRAIDRLLNDPELAPAQRAANLFVAGCMVRAAAQYGVGAEGHAELQRHVDEAKQNLPGPAAGAEPFEP